MRTRAIWIGVVLVLGVCGLAVSQALSLERWVETSRLAAPLNDARTEQGDLSSLNLTRRSEYTRFQTHGEEGLELWGSWSSDVGQTLDQAAGSSPGRQRPSGARTVRAVTNRRSGWCSQVLTQRWDSLEGPRRAEVQTRQEGRLCDKREQSSRHEAHPPRPSCHILPGEWRLAVRLVPATMRRGLCCKPTVWSRMPVLPSITPP